MKTPPARACIRTELLASGLRKRIYGTPGGPEPWVEIPLSTFNKLRDQVLSDLDQPAARSGRSPWNQIGDKVDQLHELLTAENPLSINRIAKLVGVSRPTVKRHRDKILGKLK